MNPFLLVFLGGGAGSVCRYALGVLLPGHLSRYPWATLCANALACFVLGFLTGIGMQGRLSDTHRLLFATGFCGGFSTFSTFTAETWALWQQGHAATAVANVVLHWTVSLLCLLLGLKAS